MKNLIVILFIFIGSIAKAQFPSQQTPTQFSTGWFKQGWNQSDSGHILANRLPNFTPRFPGTTILYQQAGVDSSILFWNGGRWIKVGDNVTASNGLTKTAGDIKIGGILTEPTFIDNDGNEFFLHGTAGNTMRTQNGSLLTQASSGAISASLIASNSSTTLFSEVNAVEGSAYLVGGRNGRFYNTVNADSNSVFLATKTNVSPKRLILDTLGYITLDAYPSLTQETDTSTYKPVAINSSGKIVPMASWASGSGSGLTSVGLSMPSAFSVSGSPLTSNGTINVSGAGATSQYIRGNGTLATFDTSAIPNFYLKVRGLLTGSSPITFNQITGGIGINNANVTGTKGAASFTSSFSDNGNGLIDLADVLSAGSCTGCNLTIDSKGRVTGYADGAGGATNNVNIGAGYRPVNAVTQEMRTYFAGFGARLDSVANANGLTWSADTARGSGLPTYWYIDSSIAAGGGGSGTVTNVTGTTNRITVTNPTTTPVIDIAATYVGQTSLTTLGTITTGTWNGTAIGATFGGTGQTTVTTGDLLYGSAANTWSKLAGVATGNALISGGVGVAPSWGKIGLTTHVSGILPVANGGTGTATPSLVAGTSITITGTWPNQTINSTGGGGSGTVTQVNTGYGLSGGPITTTGTIVADTSSSNGLATKNYVTNIKVWPQEAPIGTIINKNSWSNLTDFVKGTTGSPTTSLALNGNFVDYSVSSINWSNYTRFLYTRPTALPRWTFKTRFKMITAPGAGTTGFGIGTKSIIGGSDVLCYVSTTISGSGTLAIVKGDGSATWATGSSSTINQNDIVELTMSFKDSLVTFSAQNITTGASVSTISYTNTLISAASPVSGLTNWAFIGHSTVPCTWQIQSAEITSDATRNANLYCLGDSKTLGAFADYFATRFGSLLNNTYPRSVIYAAGGARISDFVNYMQDELTNLNGVQYLMSLGSNDKRAGATLAEMQDSYTKLVKILQGGGARVLHIVIPEDSTGAGIGLSTFKQWVEATYPSDYIDVWTFMSTGNKLKSAYNSGDGVHPNQAGNSVIDSLVRASGKVLVNPVNRRGQVRVTDYTVKTSGDSVFVSPQEKAEWYVDHADRNGAWRTGVLQDNGVTAGASTTRLLAIAGAQFNVNGGLAVNGAGGGVFWSDRDAADQTVGQTSIYDQAGRLIIYNLTNGSALIKIDTSRRSFFVNNLADNTLQSPTATIHIQGNKLGVANHAPLKVDSCTLLGTPEAYAIEATADSIYWTNKLGTRVALNRNGGGSATTIYNGDGTVSGNRAINVNNNNITFSDANVYKISADFFYQAKADGSRSYGAAIDPSATGRQSWQFGYLPFLRGVGLYVDTLNNVGLGDATQTNMPLYTTGNSAFVRNGFQSQQGNFFAVTDVTTNTTLSLVSNFVTVDATAGNITITLPAASAAFGGGMGLDMVFKRLDGSVNTVTVQRAGSDTIDGASSFTLLTQYDFKKVRAISASSWAIY